MTFLSDRIRENLGRDDGRLIEYRGEWVSRAELNHLVRQLMRLFDEHELPQGAPIAVMVRNHPQQVAAILAVWGSQRCLLILNALMPDERLANDIARLRPSLIVGESADWARAEILSATAAIGAAGIELPADFGHAPQPVETLERITGQDFMPPSPETAVHMLSSGTTGTPKRIPLTHGRLERIQASMPPADLGATPHPPVQFVFGSLAHMIGVASMFGFVAGNYPMALFEKFTLADWRAAMQRHKPNAVALPPATMRMVLDAGVTREEFEGVRVIRTGTAPLPRELAHEMYRTYGIPILATYGATEFAGAVASWSLEDFEKYWSTHLGAGGRLHPGVEARIVDPTSGEILGLNAEGIIELRGPALGLQEWMRTTDRASFDAEGFLWIHGRADNAIVRGGFKVHPDDVNEVLEQHPAVREAFCVGVPDERLGQAPVAAVILHEGAQATEAEIISWAHSRLLPYQTPVRLKIVDDFPRGLSFKPSGPGVQALFLGDPNTTAAS